jgi:hypothetical protein
MKKLFFITKWSRLEFKKTLVQFSIAKWPPNHSKTGRFVRFSNAKKRWLPKQDGRPFENRTQIVSEKWPFENQTVQFSDVDCFQMINVSTFWQTQKDWTQRVESYYLVTSSTPSTGGGSSSNFWTIRHRIIRETFSTIFMFGTISPVVQLSSFALESVTIMQRSSWGFVAAGRGRFA